MPTVKIRPNQIVVDRDMSIAEWCAKHGRKRGYFYDLRNQARAPELLAGRISQEEDRAWKRRELRRDKSVAARRERERKSELARVRGKLAAQSPLHPCNRKKRPD